MGKNEQGNSAAVNYLKTRDDAEVVEFSQSLGESKPGKRVFIASNACSWASASQAFGVEKLRERIEPWLTALCQTEHFSLLIGSGLTHAVHFRAANRALPGMTPQDFGAFDELVDKVARPAAQAAGREAGNIEDQLRVANELLRGLRILGIEDDRHSVRADALQAALENVIAAFANSLLAGELNVVSAPETDREGAFNYLVSFLMSFASRVGTRDRLHIFTTNYDRLIEAGAEVAGLHLLDRFVGSIAPIFRSSRLDLDMHYNPPGIRGEPRYLEGVARFTKLHGSLDWIERDRNILRMGLPFGATSIAPFLETAIASKVTQLLIYPNAAKDRETAEYPYVELFRDLAAAICRPNHALVVYGYAFGDEHINRVIEDMLTIPSTHLVVISYDDPLKRIIRFYQRSGRHAQITLMIGRHLADLSMLVDNYLPKPAIDRTTFRMSELLKARWGTGQREQSQQDPPAAAGPEGQ